MSTDGVGTETEVVVTVPSGANVPPLTWTSTSYAVAPATGSQVADTAAGWLVEDIATTFVGVGRPVVVEVAVSVQSDCCGTAVSAATR